MMRFRFPAKDETPELRAAMRTVYHNRMVADGWENGDNPFADGIHPTVPLKIEPREGVLFLIAEWEDAGGESYTSVPLAEVMKELLSK